MIKIKHKLKKGFTIIELLVVIFIFMVISGMVIFNYGAFRSDVSVENLAQDIALSVRRAQVYAVSTKGADTAVFPSYGVHFNLPSTTTNAILGNNKAFVFFADLPDALLKNIYEQNSTSCGNVSGGATPDECLEIINVNTSDKIFELCDGMTCYTEASDPSVSIVFVRPDTEAEFCFKLGSSSCSKPSYVKIKVKSINGKERSISVWQSGQISTQ